MSIPFALWRIDFTSSPYRLSTIGQAHRLFGVALYLFEMEYAKVHVSSQNHQYGDRATCFQGSR
jgi:hypothetical protein